MIAGSKFLGGVVGLILALTGAGGAIAAVSLPLVVLRLDLADAAPPAPLAVACLREWGNQAQVDYAGVSSNETDHDFYYAYRDGSPGRAV